jgi:hypothetical protein
MACNGTIICPGANKSIIQIKDGKKQVKTLRFEMGDLCLETTAVKDNSLSDKKCFRFYGKGVLNNNFYEHFACGNSASFGNLPNDNISRTLLIDGVNIMGTGYVYRSGTQSVSPVEDDAYAGSGIISSGGCPCLMATKVIVKSAKGTILHNKNYASPATFESSCDGCPPGTVKCEGHKGYPGYCCVPCADIARKLDNIVRGK